MFSSQYRQVVRLGGLAPATKGTSVTLLSYHCADQMTWEANTAGLLAHAGVVNTYDFHLRRLYLSLYMPSGAFDNRQYACENASRLQAACIGSGTHATFSCLASSPLVSNIVFQLNSATPTARPGKGRTMAAAAACCLLAGAAWAAPQAFRPGEIWPDDRGRHIQAHGGGILKLDDTYYWFGEDRSQENDRSRRYASCYSSKDLAHWTFRNQVVNMAAPEGLNLGRGWVLERPKVFFNPKTRQFVLYAHLDDAGYKLARVAVATCGTVDGTYAYLKSFRPLGHESRDIGQFIDDDGTAYLIFEDRPFGFRIARLSEDFLGVEKQMCLISAHLEGGAVVHYGALYYAIGSALTGWQANPNKYATAASLEGPWSEFKDIAPPETNTYGSQSTMMLKVAGTKGTTVIFMADLWKPRAQWDSRYLWMPLEIGQGRLWLPQPREWTLDVRTGEAAMSK